MANAACKTVVGCKVHGDSLYTLAVAMTLFYADKHIACKWLCYNTKKLWLSIIYTKLIGYGAKLIWFLTIHFA